MQQQLPFKYENLSNLYVVLPSLQLEDDYYPLELRECKFEYTECKVEKFLLMMGCPILVALSVVGNFLTFSVMLRAKLRHTATAVLIATLAVMDTIATFTGLSRHFILKTFGVDVRQLSGVSCTAHRFILYVSLDTSSWLLALIAVERFMAVCKPHKYKALKSASVGLKAVGTVILIQAAFNIHVFWTRGKHWTMTQLIEDDQVKLVEINCGYTSKAARFFWTNHQGWMVMLWYCFIPFTVMLILSILIIRRLRELKQSSHSRQGSGLSATGLTKQANSMTRMLLSVTLYFIIITTPVFIFTMFQSLLFYNSVVDEHRIAKIELVDACLTILLYLNHSINFCLYCITGRRFRRELGAMLNCWKTFNRINASQKLGTKKPEDGIHEKGKMLEQPNYDTLANGSSPMLLRSHAQDTNVSTINISGL